MFRRSILAALVILISVQVSTAGPLLRIARRIVDGPPQSQADRATRGMFMRPASVASFAPQTAAITTSATYSASGFAMPSPGIIVASGSGYKSPPGYHRHVAADGTVVEHSDVNKGNYPAHAGVNLSKYTGPVAPTSRVVRYVLQCDANGCRMVPVTSTFPRPFLQMPTPR